MSDSLKLQVAEVDEAGRRTPVTDARVVLARRDLLQGSRWPHDDLLQTHVHSSGGFYGSFVGASENQPTVGEWLLVVSKPSMSPVVQRLTLKLTGNVLQANSGWGADSEKTSARAATVSIVNAGGCNSEDAPEHTTINVLLFERSEVVGITGHDHSGAEYAYQAEGRRNLLRKRNLVNIAVLSTILHANRRLIITSVKSADPDPKSWITLDERELAPDARDLSILDFYAYLNSIGQAHPETVVEAGIFSHAWLMGPIIMNTADNTNSTVERDAADTDGRQKDWIPMGRESRTPTGTVTEGRIMQPFPDLARAFRKPDGALRIWGCAHMTNLIAECIQANQRRRSGTARDEFFRVPLRGTNGGHYFGGGEEYTTLDHIKRTLGMTVQSNLYGRSLEPYDLRGVVTYPGAAARFLESVPVFAGPPGLGSLLGHYGGEYTFYIHSGVEPPGQENPYGNPGGENPPVFECFREEFGDAFILDELRYANYAELLKAELPDPGWRTERFATYYDEEQYAPAVVLRLPSGLEIHARVQGPTVSAQIFDRPRGMVLSGVSGHLYTIRKRAIARVQRRGPAFVVLLNDDKNDIVDSAVFVGADGRSIWMESAQGKNQFTPRTKPIELTELTFLRGLWWGDPKTALPPITTAVVEAVTPRWYW